MRIVFFGSGGFGAPTLTRLLAEHEVAGVVTQPDRPAGRGKALTPTPIGALAECAGAQVIKTGDANEPAVCARIRAIPADAWVVIAFGQKLGPALLEGRFAVNLHASLLPRWRGAAPINHAILAGDAETGNSVITLAQRMDAGLVLGQSRRAIEPPTTAGDLHDLLAADGPQLVLRVLDEHARGALTPREQDPALVTAAPKLSRADAWVDFTRPADECRRRIHALMSWPGVTAAIDGKPLKLLRVQAEPLDTQESPGTLVDSARGVVACAPGTALRLLEVQPAGKKAMSWDAYARGHAPAQGAKVEGGAPC